MQKRNRITFLAELVPKNLKQKSKSFMPGMSKDKEVFYGCLHKEIISWFDVKISWWKWPKKIVKIERPKIMRISRKFSRIIGKWQKDIIIIWMNSWIILNAIMTKTRFLRMLKKIPENMKLAEQLAGKSDVLNNLNKMLLETKSLKLNFS